MKKTYMIPEMEVVRLNISSAILTGSMPKSEETVDTYDAPTFFGGDDQDW